MVNRKKGRQEGEGENTTTTRPYTYTHTSLITGPRCILTKKEKLPLVAKCFFCIFLFFVVYSIDDRFCFAGATTTKVRNEEKEGARKEKKKRKKATPNYFLTTITNEQLYTGVYIYIHIHAYT